jgi:hypothetical protein
VLVIRGYTRISRLESVLYPMVHMPSTDGIVYSWPPSHSATISRTETLSSPNTSDATESANAAHCVVFDYTRGILEIPCRTLVRTDRPGQKADAVLRKRTWAHGWVNRGAESGLILMRVSCGNAAREQRVWAH